MKIIRLVLLMALMVSGCATIPRGSGPQPGDAVFINHNEGAYAHSVLFPDQLAKDRLFALDPKTGGLMWAEQPLGKFVVRPALSREFPRIGRLPLQPNADYTLYIAWARFGRMIGEDVVHFGTNIDPYWDCRVGRLGGRTCASVIVDLPGVNTSGPARFSFHKTINTGEWIKAFFGL